MSEIEIGDKGKGLISDASYTVIGVDEEVLWVKTPGGMRVLCKRENFVPAPTFFEAGKTYIDKYSPQGKSFRCDFVGTVKGRKYAAGVLVVTRGATYPTIIMEHDSGCHKFERWMEED